MGRRGPYIRRKPLLFKDMEASENTCGDVTVENIVGFSNEKYHVYISDVPLKVHFMNGS